MRKRGFDKKGRKRPNSKLPTGRQKIYHRRKKEVSLLERFSPFR